LLTIPAQYNPYLQCIYLVFTLRATFVDHSCTVQPVLAVHIFLQYNLILAVHLIPAYPQ
jgi:hypothetical protein